MVRCQTKSFIFPSPRWVGPAFDPSRNGPDGASKWDWETLRRVANTLCPKTDTRTVKQKPGGKSGDNLEPELCSKSTSTTGSTRAKKLMEKITEKICSANLQSPNQNNGENKTTTTEKPIHTRTTKSSSAKSNESKKAPDEELSKLKNFILNSEGDFKKILTKIATVLGNKTALSTASPTTRPPRPKTSTVRVTTSKQPTRGSSPKKNSSSESELGRVRTDNVKITWFKPANPSAARRKPLYEDTFSK